jgi:hypothetical protein
MKSIFVFYNLHEGKNVNDMGYYYIPTDWNPHSYTVLCKPSYIKCECPFNYVQGFAGQLQTWANTHDYLFAFFTELVFRGIVKEFKLENEFIAP